MSSVQRQGIYRHITRGGKAMKKSFVLYTDTYDAVEGFTDAELGKLYRLIFEYHRNPNNPVGFSVSQKIQTAFSFFKAQFKRDLDKYNEVSEKRSEVGKMGGLASAQKRWGNSEAKTVSKSNQNNQLVKMVSKVSKVTDSDNVSDKDKLASVAQVKSLSPNERAWNEYSPSLLSEKNITDPYFVANTRRIFLEKAKAATENSVRAFIEKQQQIAPDEEYYDFSKDWPKA